jgi:hypothetical protein
MYIESCLDDRRSEKLDLDFFYKNPDDAPDNFIAIYYYFFSRSFIIDFHKSNEVMKEIYDLQSDELKKMYSIHEYKDNLYLINQILLDDKNSKKDKFIEAGYEANDGELKIVSKLLDNEKILKVLLKKVYSSKEEKFKNLFSFERFQESMLKLENLKSLEKALKNQLLKEIYDSNKHLSLIFDFEKFKNFCEEIDTFVKESNVDLFLKKSSLLEDFIHTSKIFDKSNVIYDVKNEKITINERSFDFYISEIINRSEVYKEGKADRKTISIDNRYFGLLDFRSNNESYRDYISFFIGKKLFDDDQFSYDENLIKEQVNILFNLNEQILTFFLFFEEISIHLDVSNNMVIISDDLKEERKISISTNCLKNLKVELKIIKDKNFTIEDLCEKSSQNLTKL